MIDVQKKLEEIRQNISSIVNENKTGFSTSIDLGRKGRKTYWHSIEILAARPKVNTDGSVRSWCYAILLIAFDLFHSNEFNHHVFLATKTSWSRDKNGKIVGATFVSSGDESGIQRITISRLSPGEYPDEDRIWHKHFDEMESDPEKEIRALKQIHEIFDPIAEALINQ